MIPRRVNFVADGFTGDLATRNLLPGVSPKLARRGPTSCEDTVGVFITSKSTSFASRETQNSGDSGDRGDVDTVDDMGLLEGDDWVCLHFSICTNKEPAEMWDQIQSSNRKHEKFATVGEYK